MHISMFEIRTHGDLYTIIAIITLLINYVLVQGKPNVQRLINILLAALSDLLFKTRLISIRLAIRDCYWIVHVFFIRKKSFWS